MTDSQLSRQSWLRWGVVITGILVGFVGPATAHRLSGTRFDAPIPLAYLFAGAAITVIFTAVLLSLTGSVTSRVRSLIVLPPTIVGLITRLAQGGFLLVFFLVLIDGLVGRQVGAENVATLLFWPVWLKGLAIVSILVGSPWRVVSPWRTLYRFLSALEGRPIQFRPYPNWLTVWPAFIGFLLLVGIGANLTILPRSPSSTAAVVACYALLMLGGGVVFGSEWFERADPLAVFYRLLGRVAPIQFKRRGAGVEVVVRPPWSGCLPPVRNPTLVAFVIATVYTLSFDGFTSTPEFQSLTDGVRNSLGVGPVVHPVLYLVGLAGFIGVFWIVVALAARSETTPHAARAFAPTILPITASYEIAHNLPYVFANLGRLPVAFGGRSFDPLWWLSLPRYWRMQVGLIVLGHVIAVIAAHAVASKTAESRRQVLVRHAPLVLLMVGYTVVSLWIISRPVTS